MLIYGIVHARVCARLTYDKNADANVLALAHSRMFQPYVLTHLCIEVLATIAFLQNSNVAAFHTCIMFNTWLSSVCYEFEFV